MELDDLKTLWAAHDEKLDRSLRLNERLLRETLLGRARPALSRYVRWAAAGLAVDAVLVVLLGSFMVQHVAEPLYLAAALVLLAFVVGMAVLGVLRLELMGRIDYGGSVTEIQRTLANVARVEYRTMKWVLLSSILIWVPGLLVLVKGLFGVDLFQHVSAAWIASNLALGAAAIVVGQWLARTYVERPGVAPWARRIMEHASDRKLREVTESLTELSRFEREAADT